jgi:hypothetical protein
MKNILWGIVFALSAMQTGPASSVKSSVSGSAVDIESNEPLSGLRVQIGAYVGVTDRNGEFSISGIPGGVYTVSAIQSGFVIAGNSGLSINGMRRINDIAGKIELGGGEEIHDFRIGMVREAKIIGQVSGPTGASIFRAYATLWQAFYENGRRRLIEVASLPPGRLGTGFTNEQGEYRMFGLPPGEYFLSVIDFIKTPDFANTSGYSVVTYFPAAKSAVSATPLILKPGDEFRANITVQDQDVRYGIVYGNLPLSADGPSKVLALAAFPHGEDHSSEEPVASGVIRANNPPTGNSFMAALPLGSYDFVAALTNDNRTTAYYGGTSAAVVVGEQMLQGLSMTILPNMEVRGHVTMPAGTNAKLEVPPIGLRPLYEFRAATADRNVVKPKTVLYANGTFTLGNLPEGSYTVQSFLPDGLYLADVLEGGQSILKSGLTLNVDRPIPLEVVVGGDGATVDGVLESQFHQPVGFMQVVLVPAQRGIFARYRTASTDYHGHFRLADLAPGDYKLFAWTVVPDGAWTSPEYLNKYEALGVPINVVAGQNVDGVHVSLIQN